MRLASGREIDATANHRFLAVDGWTPLSAAPGGARRIASPRHIPAPLRPRSWPQERVVTVAQMLGAVGTLAGQRRRCSSGPRGETSIPDAVFRLPKSQVAMFLRQLWGVGGTVTADEYTRSGRIAFASASRRLLDGIAALLLRFGIASVVDDSGPGATGSTLDIPGQRRAAAVHPGDRRPRAQG